MEIFVIDSQICQIGETLNDLCVFLTRLTMFENVLVYR